MFLKLFLLFASAAGSLPWIENDYSRAIDAAKSRHVPLFAEVWAPW